MPVVIPWASFSCVRPLEKGGIFIAVPGEHLVAAPIVLAFIDSTGSHLCPYGFNAILPLL